MSENNSIRIHYGTKQVTNVIEIQAYINQLERLNYDLRKQVKVVAENLAKQQDAEEVNHLRLRLNQAYTEIAYYQAMELTKNNGRPGKLSIQDVYDIRNLREKGNSLKIIADRYNVSIALIHKVTKDLGKDNRKKQI